MNETITLCLEIIFWLALFIVFYTYLGYGIVLYVLVKLKELFVKPVKRSLPASDAGLPEVTLFITAFNEEDVVDEKMENSLELDYPADKLHIVWVTDGSDDSTNERLQTRWQGKATVHFQPLRQGKTAAMTRGMTLVDTPLVVFTDANTMVNREAIREIVLAFQDPKVGCVAGEKRIAVQTKDGAAAGGEGIYWKYESTLKALDARLYSAVGAAGELFAVRRELFEAMEPDTLLDDFILSLRITMKGYTIAYCTNAYAIESGSADMQEEEKRKANAPITKVSLEDLFSQIQAGEMKNLNIIVKADVMGSVEAVKASLEKISNDEVRVRVIHGAVGAINESDVMLAATSNAIIVGFNVRPDAAARDSAARNHVDMRMYRVIYDAIDEIEAAMKGMLAPKFREAIIGHAEIRQTYKVSSVGTVAGCYVTDGKIQRACDVRIVRDGIVVHEGHLASLQRFKDSVKEVAQGYECGLSFEKYNDIKVSDIVEAYVMEQIEQ